MFVFIDITGDYPLTLTAGASVYARSEADGLKRTPRVTVEEQPAALALADA